MIKHLIVAPDSEGKVWEDRSEVKGESTDGRLGGLLVGAASGEEMGLANRPEYVTVSW